MQAVGVDTLVSPLHVRELTLLDLWSAKFYPYTKPGVDPIFAVVGGKHVRSLWTGQGLSCSRGFLDSYLPSACES